MYTAGEIWKVQEGQEGETPKTSERVRPWGGIVVEARSVIRYRHVINIGGAVLLTLATIYLVAFIVPNWLPRHRAADQHASAEIQALSSAIAARAGMAPVDIVMRHDVESIGHAECAPGGPNCRIAISDRLAGLMPSVPLAVSAVITHEYGHLRQQSKGTDAPLALLLLPALLSISFLLWALLHFKGWRWAGALLAASTCAAVVFSAKNTFCLDTTFLWLALLIWSVFPPPANIRGVRWAAIILIGAGATWAVGMAITTGRYRIDEAAADVFASEVIGTDGVAQMLCQLEHEAAQSGAPALLRSVASWSDIHPSHAERMASIGKSTKDCHD